MTESIEPTAQERKDVEALIAAGTTNATYLVHKEGAEGAILINQGTGLVTTPTDERPEWASGLIQAQTAERMKFYETRIGPEDARLLFAGTQAIEMSDLGWVAMDQEGEPVEMEPSGEFRSSVITAHLLDLGALVLDADGIPQTNPEHDVIMFDADTRRSPEELSALEEAQRQGWETIAADQGVQRKAG